MKRPGLAIELDPNIGLLCAANMQITGEESDLQRTMDRVLIGDGTDAENAIVLIGIASGMQELGHIRRLYVTSRPGSAKRCSKT